jgi:hypothetical protein
MAKKWIGQAIKKPGSLRASTRATYGKQAFTSRGTIKKEYVQRMSRKPGKTGQRARLALTLRKMRQ